MPNLTLWMRVSDKGVKDFVLASQSGVLLSSSGQPKRLTKANNGYLTVSFGGKNHLVHRLIAKAFIPNPLGHPVVNHKDGNKENNEVNNLEWCTHSHNRFHASSLGLGNVGRHHNKGKLNEIDVLVIRKLEGLKSSREVARMFSVNKSSIQRIWRRECWKTI